MLVVLRVVACYCVNSSLVSAVCVHVTVGHGLVCLLSVGCCSLWLVSVLDVL